MKELSKEELSKRKYAFPEERKYPMPDKEHVLSAIKFFNYVDADKEGTLAKEILKRIKEYSMTDINVGKDNRFLKYYKPKNEDKEMNDNLSHSAKGQTWSQHKYIDIKNGHYIYPKFMYRKKAKEYANREQALLNNLKKSKVSRRSEYLKIESDFKRGLINKKKAGELKKEVDKKYNEQDNSFRNQIKANAYTRIKNLYKYQNSWNNKSANEIKNTIAKGKAFLDNLFNKKEKPKRTLEEAITLNNKLRGKDKNIKRKNSYSDLNHPDNVKIIDNRIKKNPENKVTRKGMSSTSGKNSYKLAVDRAKDTVSNMHSNNIMESGNNPHNGNSIKRKSDTDQMAIKFYSMKNGFEKAVKKFGKKGEAFLLSIFGRK